MKEFSAKKAVLTAAVFACGMMGTIELPKGESLSYRLFDAGVAVSVSTAAANQAIGPVHRSSCALIRYYVAKFKPQLTALFGQPAA